MSRATLPFSIASSAGPRAAGVQHNAWAERLAHALPYLLFAAAMLLLDSMARGATQEEFLKSLHNSVNNGPGSSGEITARGLAMFLGVLGLIVAFLVLAQKLHKRFANRPTGPVKSHAISKPASINQPRKLTKEIAKAAGLSRDEVRQLKTAAEERGHASPLTLLLCPSLLIEAAQKQDTAADKTVLARVARRAIG